MFQPPARSGKAAAGPTPKALASLVARRRLAEGPTASVETGAQNRGIR